MTAMYQSIEEVPLAEDLGEKDRYALWRTLFLMVEYKKITPLQLVDYVCAQLEHESNATNIMIIDRLLTGVLKKYFHNPVDQFDKVFKAIHKSLSL